MFNKKRIIIFIGFILLMFFMTTFAGGPTQNDTVATRLVTFIDGITENEISKQEIEVGGEALVPDAPKHTNYVFVGWFDGELEVKNFKNILSNLTVTAKYAGDINNNGIADELEERYTVTFVDGFNNLVISRVDVLSGMDAEAPVVPTHTGYTFVGWNGDYTNVTTTRTITANYRLTSVRVETFTVTFVDGVSNEILSTQTIESGLSASAPVPKSYAKKVFVGWDKSYTNVTGDLTITSKYADDLNENGVDDNLDNKYSVVFNVTGNGVLNGTLNYSDILEGLTLEEALIVIPTPTADAGYTFMGWLVTPEKDTKVNGNLVFTAVFEDITKPTFHPEYWRKTVEADKTATFTCPSATGSDTAGGNVVVTLLNNTVEMGVPGDYKCQYVTEDANGNKAYNDVFIKVVDTTKPTFHPEYWRKTVEADKTATFTCPSATGSDNAEGNVVVTLRNNTVNMGVPGDYKCQYVTEDANGNKAYNDVFIKVVDTTKPTFHPEYWRKTVEVDRNATFTCPSATGSDNAEGNVTVTLHNNTVDMSNPGDYKCQYVTEDANGNKAYNDVFIKVVDTTRPTFELLLPTEGQCLNANDVPTKAIASDNHLLEIITINLYSENNILIRGSSTRGINDITGSHEYNFKDLNLPDGKYVIKANAKDVTGNTSATTTREFCIDSTAPVLKININKTTNKTYLNDGDHVNQSQTPELEVVDTNLDKMIVMNENREVKKVFEGPYKYTTSYNKINWLSDGTYIIYAIDKAGNISNEMTITLDSVAPSATVAYNPDVVNNGSVTATVTFSEPLKQKPVLKAKEYDGGAVKSWMKCNTELTVCTLQHWYNRNYVIEFYDLADNLGEVTISFNTIDKSAPIIDEITHTPTTTAKEVTVTVTAHDKGDTTNGKKDGLVAGLHTEAYSFDGGVTWQADNTFVVSDNTTLKIVVRDALGNKTKVNDYAITNIKKDTTAPVITVLGDNPAYVLENDNYVDSGATALDETDGDLTNLIVTNGTVDTSTLGTYTLTYVVSDKSLNEATATRTVKVLDPDGDEDNDGFTNEEELEEGTDPEDDTDFPSLNGLKLTLKPATIIFVYPNDNGLPELNDIMSGAEAVDSLGKSVDVLIDKKLNELTLGFNKVNYIATDRSGNVVTKSRTVTLNNKCLDDNDCYEVIKKPANLIYNTGDTNYGNLDLEVKMNLAIAVPNITANSFTLTPLADLTKTPGVKTVTATYLYRANTVLQTVTVTFDITVIDEENPELTVNPATVEMTYGDDLNVLEGVTALDDADGDITNNITADKTDTKTFALGNNTVTYTVADSSGNSVTETRTYYVKRNTQQVNSLTSTIIYMPHVEGQYVNRNVNAEVRFYETVTIINNPSAIYTFTDNGTFTLRFKDKDGVEGSVDLAVSWIDKKAPVLSIEPDTVTVEKGSSFDLLSGVTATDDLSGVKSITASKKIEDFVLGNNIVTYTATDKAGNTTKGTRMYILTITPEELETYATITYSSTSLTKDSVTATISFSENDITVTNNGGSNSYVFTENGTFTFEFTDKYGVVATKTAEVTWIDDVLPDATFTYSPTGWSNNSIEVTLNATEVITTPIGWTKINDTTYTKVFTDYQSSVSVLLTDAVGNENTVATGEIKVDKVAPSIVINNANINANNQASVDVNVSITDDLSGVKLSYYIPAGNNLGFDTSTKAKALAFINDQANNAILPGLVITGGKFTVIANGEYWIYSIDNAGNEIISDTKIKVTNLYEPDPTETDNEEGFVDPVTGLRVTVSKQAHDYRGLFLRLDANRTVSISNNNGFEVAEVRLAQGIKTLADFQNDLTLGTKIEITNGVALNKVQSTFTNMYTIYFKNTEGDEQVHVFYNSSYIGVGIPATDLFWKWGRI